MFFFINFTNLGAPTSSHQRFSVDAGGDALTEKGFQGNLTCKGAKMTDGGSILFLLAASLIMAQPLPLFPERAATEATLVGTCLIQQRDKCLVPWNKIQQAATKILEAGAVFC